MATKVTAQFPDTTLGIFEHTFSDEATALGFVRANSLQRIDLHTFSGVKLYTHETPAVLENFRLELVHD